ncbi:hypothetical protein FMLHJGGC_00202 [Staphylococcus phage BSwM-KMM1]|nr:hypothetical protein FMLHJGGC_00202 [Pseudomonas phage BSwM KMM1]
MNKYLIVLKDKNNKEFLNEYDIQNIEIYMGVIVIAYMLESTAKELETHSNIESIEKMEQSMSI